MSSSRWIKLQCGDELQAILSNHPNAFLLLTQIAMRARWKDCPITKLKAGQALIGDWQNAGLPSIKAYRKAKERLEGCQLAAFQGTSKGTIATLLNSAIYAVFPEAGGHQEGKPGANEGQARGQQGATNKTDRKKDRETDTLFPDESGIESCLPKGWKQMKTDERKRRRVIRNTEEMARIGEFVGRKEGTLWTVAEALALRDTRPSEEEMKIVGRFYDLVIPKESDYRRREISTLLNHWTGEVDKARGHFATQDL